MCNEKKFIKFFLCKILNINFLNSVILNKRCASTHGTIISHAVSNNTTSESCSHTFFNNSVRILFYHTESDFAMRKCHMSGNNFTQYTFLMVLLQETAHKNLKIYIHIIAIRHVCKNECYINLLMEIKVLHNH